MPHILGTLLQILSKLSSFCGYLVHGIISKPEFKLIALKPISDVLNYLPGWCCLSFLSPAPLALVVLKVPQVSKT